MIRSCSGVKSGRFFGAFVGVILLAFLECGVGLSPGMPGARLSTRNAIPDKLKLLRNYEHILKTEPPPSGAVATTSVLFLPPVRRPAPSGHQGPIPTQDRTSRSE